MLKKILPLVGIAVVVGLSFLRSEAKMGERCDGFMTKGCEGNSSCVESDDGSYCSGGSCVSEDDCPKGYECYETTFNGVDSGGECFPIKKESPK